MTKNSKRGGGADEHYATHLFGSNSAYFNNTAQSREVAITRMLQTTLTDMAINRFKWMNIPGEWDPRFIESILLVQGLAIVYWDRDYEALLAVRGAPAGYVNMVDNPVSFVAIGPGGGQMAVSETDPALFFNKTLGAYQPMVHTKLGEAYPAKDKCIPIWNNYTRTPDINVINIYAPRLAIIDRTLEINTRNARRNKVIKGSPNTQLSMVNFNRQLDEGVELLQVTGVMEDMQFIEALDLGVTPDAYEKLGVHRTRVWNECMIMLGIDSANQEKKERMVAAEVSANDSQADAIRFKSLKARRDAAAQINKVFGLNIEVEFEIEVEREEKMQDALDAEKDDKSTSDDPYREDAREDDK